jgi:hypothetical protein
MNSTVGERRNGFLNRRSPDSSAYPLVASVATPNSISSQFLSAQSLQRALFGIDAVRALLTIQHNPDQSCEAVDAIARARLGEVERRIESLLQLKAEPERMIAPALGVGLPSAA